METKKILGLAVIAIGAVIALKSISASAATKTSDTPADSNTPSGNTPAEIAPTYINNVGVTVTATKGSNGKYSYTDPRTDFTFVWDNSAKKWVKQVAPTNSSSVTDVVNDMVDNYISPAKKNWELIKTRFLS